MYHTHLHGSTRLHRTTVNGVLFHWIKNSFVIHHFQDSFLSDTHAHPFRHFSHFFPFLRFPWLLRAPKEHTATTPPMQTKHKWNAEICKPWSQGIFYTSIDVRRLRFFLHFISDVVVRLLNLKVAITLAWSWNCFCYSTNWKNVCFVVAIRSRKKKQFYFWHQLKCYYGRRFIRCVAC